MEIKQKSVATDEERALRLSAALGAVGAVKAPVQDCVPHDHTAAEALLLALQILLGPQEASELIDSCSLKGFSR